MASNTEVAAPSIAGASVSNTNSTTVGQRSGGIATPNAGSHMWDNPTPTQEHYIHVPDFLSDYLDSNQPIFQRNDELLVKNG
eukprot:scaffold190503_cov58-Attheya_sp.AAC.1